MQFSTNDQCSFCDKRLGRHRRVSRRDEIISKIIGIPFFAGYDVHEERMASQAGQGKESGLTKQFLVEVSKVKLTRVVLKIVCVEEACGIS